MYTYIMFILNIRILYKRQKIFYISNISERQRIGVISENDVPMHIMEL